MGRKNYQILTIFLLWPFISCIKDKPSGIKNNRPGGTGNVYIVCEGNYGSGNASLFAYDPLHDSIFGDLYKIANNNQPLGDVFQSMTRIGNNFFLAINNSNKVVVIDAVSYKLAGTINIPQPRYILDVGNNKAYVSSLYSKNVYIINEQTFSITGTIQLPTMNPEGMCLHEDTAVITSWDTSNRNIYLVDVFTDKITATVKVAGFAPQEAIIDKENLLWVLSGDQPEGKTAALTRVNISTGAILDSFIFPNTVDPLKPVLNNTKDTIYFIEADYYGGISNNGIYRMSIYDDHLPVQPFIAAVQNQYFWALGIDPITGNIYIGDPKGFTQSGMVSVYRPGGAPATQFKVGLGPGHFYFDR